MGYIRKNGKRLDVRELCGKRLRDFTVVQGSCTDGQYIYLAFERKARKSRSQAVKIVKLSITTFEVKKVSKALKIGHANDMCIRGRTLYVTHSAGESVVHRVDADTLEKESDIEVSNKEYNGIATYGSGYILRVMGGDKMLIVNKRWHKVRTIRTKKHYEVSQGMTQKGGIIYRAYSDYQSSDKNRIVTFDKRGRKLHKKTLDITGELESCFLHNGKLWVVVYRKKKINGKMKYMAYIAKEE